MKNSVKDIQIILQGSHCPLSPTESLRLCNLQIIIKYSCFQNILLMFSEGASYMFTCMFKRGDLNFHFLYNTIYFLGYNKEKFEYFCEFFIR